jgi:hypothetical protein
MIILLFINFLLDNEIGDIKDKNLIGSFIL